MGPPIEVGPRSGYAAGDGRQPPEVTQGKKRAVAGPPHWIAATGGSDPEDNGVGRLDLSPAGAQIAPQPDHATVAGPLKDHFDPQAARRGDLERPRQRQG